MSSDSSSVDAPGVHVKYLPRVSWGPGTALIGIVLAYLASLMTASLVMWLALDITTTSGQGAMENLILTIASSGGFLLVLWRILRSRKLSFAHLGFRRWQSSDNGWLVRGALIYFPLLLVALWVASLIPGFDINQAQDVGYENVAGFGLLLAFVGLVVLPPLAEEMTFRGFLYRGLSSRWPRVVAAVLTSALFGLVHLQWNVAVDTFLLSMVLIYLFERTQNLWVCVALHAVKNFIAFYYLFILS